MANVGTHNTAIADASTTTEKHSGNVVESNNVQSYVMPAHGSNNNNNEITNLRLCLLILSLFCGVFVMALDTTIVGIAIPSITTEFNSLDDIACNVPVGALVTVPIFFIFQMPEDSQDRTFASVVPFMIVGTVIGTVGSALFLMLNLDTSTALWAVFLVVYGTSTGFAINLQYTVVQAILTEDLVATGNAVFQFVFQLGSALGLAIAQSIFLNQLRTSAQTLTPTIPSEVLVNAGAYDLRSLAQTEEIYTLLRQVYMNALHDTYIFPIVACGLAFLTTLALEHKNIKKIGKERERACAEH
ncbi:hypothetical protein DL769_002506 [Monosporascus sp. CRB-8-3]|nr:hypothetical protein DL769_002506 [Monosporascus sp. CRB-8-3]